MRPYKPSDAEGLRPICSNGSLDVQTAAGSNINMAHRGEGVESDRKVRRGGGPESGVLIRVSAAAAAGEEAAGGEEKKSPNQQELTRTQTPDR